MHMTRSNRVVSTTAAAVLAMVTLTAAPAFADGSSGHSSSGHSVLRARLMGSTPAPVSPVIAGINPGGKAWMNGPSNVRVRRDGRISVTIRGLVLVSTGANPISDVVATLVCDNMVRSSTPKSFALSPAGNGSTSQMISVPRHCEDPTVLIQPAGRPIYIASAMGEDD